MHIYIDKVYLNNLYENYKIPRLLYNIMIEKALPKKNFQEININNINYDFPICIFGQKIFEISLKDLKAFTSERIKYLNTKYFSLNSSYPELILIGIKNYNFKDILRLRDISKKNKIGLDLMKIGQASGTFNFLTLEKRDFITIFI